ncbi:hypothetical protein [Actinokineospora inagensis]|uniref:hypothetical protein n=1 Tax=Actinokineospora inagensis TaxID=103730 RepID=UPI0004118311|nr:hypothetical protein [Actinokineospora inagensis]
MTLRKAAVAMVLLLGCVACRANTSTPPAHPTGNSVDQELGGVESTLDNVESEMAGD